MARQLAEAAELASELPELATPERVAEWLGVTRKAVYHMVDRGEIPASAIVRIGTRLRFDVASLRSWLSEKRAPSPKRHT